MRRVKQQNMLWLKRLRGSALVAGHLESQIDEPATDQGFLRTMSCHHMITWILDNGQVWHALLTSICWPMGPHLEAVWLSDRNKKFFFLQCTLTRHRASFLTHELQCHFLRLPAVPFFFLHSFLAHTKISVTFKWHMASTRHCWQGTCTEVALSFVHLSNSFLFSLQTVGPHEFC